MGQGSKITELRKKNLLENDHEQPFTKSLENVPKN